MNYSHMHTFYVVATLGNLSKAAEQLGVSQPAVSRIISTLETEYNTKLFFRAKSGVSLTREGLNLLQSIQNGFFELKKAENYIDAPHSLEKTSIQVGATSTALEACLFHSFKKYSHLTKDVATHVFTDSSRNLVKMVNDGVLDFAFITTPTFQNDDLESYEVMSINNILIAPIIYKNKIKGKVSIKDLEQYPFVLLNKDMTFRQHLDKFFAKHNANIIASYETDNSSTLVPFVVNECGLSFVPENSAKEWIEQGKCFKVELKEKITERHVVFITKKTNDYPQFLREIKEYIIAKLKG